MVVCDYRKKLCFALDILVRNYLESGKLVNVAVVCNVAVYKESIEIVVFIICFCNSISELCCLFESVITGVNSVSSSGAKPHTNRLVNDMITVAIATKIAVILFIIIFLSSNYFISYILSFLGVLFLYLPFVKSGISTVAPPF